MSKIQGNLFAAFEVDDDEDVPAPKKQVQSKAQEKPKTAQPEKRQQMPKDTGDNTGFEQVQ